MNSDAQEYQKSNAYSRTQGRRRSTFVARIDPNENGSDLFHDASVSSTTAGQRLQSRRKSIIQTECSETPCAQCSTQESNTSNPTFSAAMIKPRRGSVLLFVAPDVSNQDRIESSTPKAGDVKTPSLISGIKFLRSRKKSSFRIGQV